MQEDKKGGQFGVKKELIDLDQYRLNCYNEGLPVG